MSRTKSSSEDDNTAKFPINKTYTTYQPAHTVQAENTDQPRESPDGLPKKRFSWKKILVILIALLIIPVIVIGIWDYKNASDASQKLFGSSNIATVLPPNSLEESQGSTNFLIIGYSADDPGHAGAELTDSVMLVSLNEQKQTGYMLSVPRDLYVSIPDYGSAKINEAFQAGERQSFTESGYPNGGPGLLEKVVSETLGVTIHHYVIVNYSAVREITNALGGITVTIESSDPRGIYDPNFKAEEGGPLKLTNGPQTIDGQTALRLTRARGSTAGSYGFPQSDFDRTQNQQRVFAAIKAKLTIAALIDPRTNKPIFDAVANNVKTDIGLNQLFPIFDMFQTVPDQNIKRVNLRDFNDKNYLNSYRTSTGQSALIPSAGISDFSEIQELLKSL